MRIYIVLGMLLCCLSAVRAEDSIPQDSVTGYGLRVTGDSLVTDTLALDSVMTDSIPQDTELRIQNSEIRNQDSDSLSMDSLMMDSMEVMPQKKSDLKAPVHYQASDSMIMMGNGTAFLHGRGELKYESMELTSEFIRMNIDSSLIYAHGVWDSINYEWKGKPVFKDGKDSYETNEITYNIKTQKGYIRHVVTQQGEGYIIADKTKKMHGDEMMLAGGQYTTCDDHDHPHFYLKMTKAKVKPGDYIAAGPSYLVVGDVPLPLAIPFGFFPFTKSYSSGIIMPNFGDDYSRGLYLSNFGYYFALCDYADLELTGDVYSKGTWAIRGKSRYIWRYHFSGNLSINYRNDVTGEKGMPNYAKRNNFSIAWTHTQDAKANPYSTFSASVNFSTSGYNRDNINSYYNPSLYSENTKSSSISYQQRFPDSPWSLSLSANLTQRTSDSTISLTAPQLTINMSSQYPFKLWRQAVLKRKGQVGGKEKWYEKISMSYSGEGQIKTNNMKEKEFLHSDFFRDWQTGMRHSVPIRASFMLFKYLSVTPSINLRDRMYFTRIDQMYDTIGQAVVQDTTKGFYNVFDFDVGLSFSTKLYGFYTPLKKLFPNSKIEKFRHVLTPSFGISYHPDFEQSFWGYYGSYDQPVYYKDSLDAAGKRVPTGEVVKQTYSRFANSPYGNAARGTSATLTFGVQNNLEMKVVNSEDTTGKKPYKVVSLIDNLGITGGYNFAADSMNWSQFTVNLRLKFPKLNNYSLNMSTKLDPYMYELNAFGRPIRTNKQYWHNGRFPHWDGFSWNFSYTISDQTITKWRNEIAKKRGEKVNDANDGNDGNDANDGTNMDAIEKDGEGLEKNGKLNGKKKNEEVEDGYVKTEFPWSISINYSLAYRNGSEFDYEKMQYKMVWRNSLSLNGNLGLGQGWKVSANMTYDFDYKKVTSCTFNVSRDLHCWNMTASINPIGPFKSYTFHIGVNASILSDLKYDKNSNESTNSNVDWW